MVLRILFQHWLRLGALPNTTHKYYTVGMYFYQKDLLECLFIKKFAGVYFY